MAVMVIFHAPDFSQAQYEALRPIVRWEEDYPDGVLLHSCAFDAAGGLHVVDLWESEEKLQTFFETRLMPGFQQVGVNPEPPQVFPVFNIDAFPGIETHTP